MFSFHTLDALQQTLRDKNLQIPLSTDLSKIQSELSVGNKKLANRIAIQPMEGCDGTADGHPGELTLRRYEKFARSGAGLLWAEATAVCEEGRANPRQLWINESTISSFQKLNEHVRQLSLKENGFAPVILMQATHSGRYSKPHGVPEPLIAYNNPLFEQDTAISKENIVCDDYLNRLIERMGQVAKQAQAAGFDGIDIKSCHRYLASELLSAYERPGSFGGSFENRTRFLRESIQAAKAAVTGDFIITSRLNVYDGFPYPYGFGVSKQNGITPDLTEPLALVKILHEDLGIKLLNITIGNPYVNPHVNRPADQQPYALPEEPLIGLERMVSCVKTIQHAYPKLAILSSGMSYLRQYSPYLAAGMIENGDCAVAGFGRMAFSYPRFAKDLLEGQFDPKQCCITCGKCSQLMRMGSMAGCVIHDPIYTQLYKDAIEKRKNP